jgi:hypothetical protein
MSAKFGQVDAALHECQSKAATGNKKEKPISGLPAWMSGQRIII